MSKIDFDVPHLCPHCDEPMQVLMPIWITPGEESIDTSEIDYESGNPQDSSNWWCDTCESHHFPKDEQDDDRGLTRELLEALKDAEKFISALPKPNVKKDFSGLNHLEQTLKTARAAIAKATDCAAGCDLA